jgi:hypothetical protein
MPGISDATILEAHAVRDDAELLISWSSTEPAGSEVYQVYRDGVLAWHGRERSCALPPGPPGVPVRFYVGVVDPADAATDFGASLPAGMPRRVRLTWVGGSYEGHELDGFHVYAGTAPGSAVAYAAPLATVPAYPGGVVLDGYGLGGYGLGGYGAAASSYSWVSAPLAGGTWHFGVKPFGPGGRPKCVARHSLLVSRRPRHAPFFPPSGNGPGAPPGGIHARDVSRTPDSSCPPSVSRSIPFPWPSVTRLHGE